MACSSRCNADQARCSATFTADMARSTSFLRATLEVRVDTSLEARQPERPRHGPKESCIFPPVVQVAGISGPAARRPLQLRANPSRMSIRHASLANAIRALAMDAVEQAKSGHLGMPMGMADVATVLWTRFLKFDPQHPDWPDRDRFVLSAGHGSMLLYLTGFPDMTLEELRRFRQLGARTAGHPEHGHAF